MAGGMDLGSGGKSKKKPLDTAINLVPFIDLMAVTISFLIMTAVWTQISRLQISQAGGAPSDAHEETSLDLTLTVTSQGYSLTTQSATYATIPMVGGSYDLKSLDEKLKALHAAYPTQRQITVQVEDKVKYLDLVKVIDDCVVNKLDGVSVSPTA